MNRLDWPASEMNSDSNVPDIVDLLRSQPFVTESSGSCLPEAESAAFVDGTLSETKREAVITHLTECRECLDLVSALVRVKTRETETVPRDLLGAALSRGSKRIPSDRSAWLRWQVVLPTAAGLLLLLSLPWLRQSSRIDRQAAEDRPPTDTIDRAVRAPGIGSLGDQVRLQILAPLEGDSVNPGNLEVRWSETTGGLFYEVEIVTDAGDLVWRGRTEETALRLPASARLQRGGYFLWVRTYLPDGKTLKSSAVGFKVRKSQ